MNMLKSIKAAIARLLGVKTRPYLTTSPLPKGPIIEPLTPSTLIHRRKPEGPANETVGNTLRKPELARRSDPVYDTWPDPFRQQRPKRVDPRPRPLLRAVTNDDPPAPAPASQGPTALEIIFAEAVMRAVSSTPELAPAPAPSYNSDYGCSRDFTPDEPSASDNRTED